VPIGPCPAAHAYAQLPRALNAADALVLPSVAEAFGLVLVEAMACGLPVIACRAHGPAAIVTDGTTGWLIPPGDEDALLDALLTAATSDEERRARGRHAQTDSRRYDWAEIAPRFASLYDELLTPPLPGSRSPVASVRDQDRLPPTGARERGSFAGSGTVEPCRDAGVA
jgi:glycosyltransferase involved in cell wall biosynthesis